MTITFGGRNFKLTDDLMSKVEKKLLQRLSRVLPSNAAVHVIFNEIKQDITAEVAVSLKSRTLRAQAASKDAIAAVDAVSDALERQMVKFKTRSRDKKRKDNNYVDVTDDFIVDALPEADSYAVKIVKTKRFALKPMDPEEAVMEMELLGHGFYVFRNSVNDEVNVVYKRNDESYGLIEPTF
ncbi:MAG: ribosome-associated translation inhibitor RaiA [Defluviitaleaceae bacterium]|nr:ribosome-associated translation inhibitor RaiA [Defluviitaleaceae bacterium]